MYHYEQKGTFRNRLTKRNPTIAGFLQKKTNYYYCLTYLEFKCPMLMYN